MASTTKTLVQSNTRETLPSIVTLASWRWRQSWYLLFMTGLGMIAAVMIVCTIPLFSEVTSTAGLRSTLNSDPRNTALQLTIASPGLSTQALGDVQKQLNPLFQQPLQSYLSTHSQFSIQLPGLTLVSPQPLKQGNQVQLFSTSMAQAASHVAITQGRLPQEDSSELETVLTPQSAASMHATIGTVISLQFTFMTTPNSIDTITRNLNLRVVGLFAPTAAKDAYWHGVSFQPVKAGDWTNYAALISNTALLHTLDGLARQYHVNPVIFNQPYTLLWNYHLDPARITINQLDNLTSQIAFMQAGITNKYGNLENSSQPVTQYPYIQKVEVAGAILDTSDGPGVLSQYRSHISVERIPVAILVLQITALILIFVSMMAELLVDRQTDAIAILRSRGASSRQIFGSLATQSLVLSLIALLIGPLLAIVAVVLIARRILPAASQDAIATLLASPQHILEIVWWYALLAAGIAVLAMIVSLIRPTRMDVLAIRRESARATRLPLWQRLNLDIVAAVIALTGYGLSLYITNIGGLLDARTRAIISAPLVLIAPIFLLIAGVLLFMRLFPFALRQAATLAGRSRGAASMLALAQMARAPRQVIRMTLLLALASAFAIFTLVFTSSQNQRTIDMASYQAGADFSGDLTSAYKLPALNPLPRVTQDYRQLPGVVSASVGYSGHGVSTGASPVVTFQIMALDSSTFSQTARWPAATSSQSLAALMQTLASKHDFAVQNNVVPIIVDQATWNTLDLKENAIFSATMDIPGVDTINCQVVGKVAHIPTVNDPTEVDNQNDVQGGMLLDFKTLSDVIYQADKGAKAPVNHVWLRTQDNPGLLTQVRSTLTNSDLRLANLADRRAILLAMQSDPLALNLNGVLTIGAITALFLALVGSLLSSWASARTRLTNFAVLRAIGTTPRQVASVLTWEQTIVYITAMLLGVIFGALLAYTVVPTLVFTSVPISGGPSDPTDSRFFAIQHILPAQIIIPLTLGIAFVALVVICVIALGMMVRVVSRPSMSQLLRINED